MTVSVMPEEAGLNLRYNTKPSKILHQIDKFAYHEELDYGMDDCIF